MFKNVFINVFEKTKAFLVDAGKIILAISIVLWFLASYGPGEKFNNAENIVRTEVVNQEISSLELDDKIASYKLEHSYIGIVGKTIEPIIRPLGYDWKIGIALVTSFAAREVFVGTLATIYSVGSAGEEEETIKQKMAAEVYPNGKKVFTLASGISLLLFYAFAMQCMATLAIVKKETNSWKWPMIQLFGMTAIAYITALISFQLFK
jgi:ferrous iron transport protein B